MPSYPIVKIPSEIQNALTALPEVPKLPKEPVEPVLELPIAPEEASGLRILIGLGILLLSGSAFDTKKGTMLGLLLFFIGAIIIVSYFRSLSTYPDELKKYEFTKLDNENKYKIKKEEYTKNLMPNYLKQKADYNNLLLQSKDPSKILMIRQHRLIDAFEKASKMVKHKNPVDYKTGVSENNFLSVLTTRFSGRIFTGATFQYAKEPSLYLPDFVIYIQKMNIHIDIEIDEPYVGATGQPIHYEGSDDQRDKAFSQQNWVVVRFTESQVISQPNECCNFICRTVSDLSLGLIKLDYEGNLPSSVAQWTKDEAHKMAFVRFRNTYLNLTFHETLTLETLNKDIESEKLAARYLDDNDLPF